MPAALVPRRQVIVGVHLVLIPIIYVAAFALRFELRIPDRYLDSFLLTVALLLPIQIVAFWVFRLYHCWWQYLGIHDLVALIGAASASSLAFVATLAVLGLNGSLPRSVLLLDWLLSIFVLGSAGLAVRWMRERDATKAWASGARRTLIVGAGARAGRLIREAQSDATLGIRPVGIVDDDARNHRLRLHGIPVIGTLDDVKDLLSRHRIELLVIATSSVAPERVRRVVEQCTGLPVQLKIADRRGELTEPSVRLNQLRAVEIEDLLGRAPVHLNARAVEHSLRDRTVLVTGGAGSIGSEIARQVASLGAARVVLVDKAESPLYFVDLELRRNYPGVVIVPAIADVTDRARLSALSAEFAPDTIFHAAAYKHVPLMEANVSEALRNNVLGTLIAAETAVECGARRFVLISTDKAVRPSSVMGASKRVAERLILGLPELRQARTDFRAVRFGNVLGSNGSVIPLFRRQIAAGGPVTVTHPDVSRYFMTIPEAAALVLQAGYLPEAAGHICMLDMGQPVRILELAEALIRLSGLQPYSEMQIMFTGLRPGEKLSEELKYDIERAIPTSIEKIRILRSDETADGRVREHLDDLMASLAGGDTRDQLRALRAFVPECVEPLRTSVSAAFAHSQPIDPARSGEPLRVLARS